MKIVVHDFAGHPGQLQLSRELAKRGHAVQHQFCDSVTTGQGATTRRDTDPVSFSLRPISLGAEFARYSPAKRLRQELRYGWLAARAILSNKPDIAVFSNVPVLPLAFVSLTLKIRKIPYIFWWQDVYSEAVRSIARSRLGRIGAVPAKLVAHLERGIAKHATAIVPITDAFIHQLTIWQIDTSKVTVIPNWGSLDEVGQRPRDNPWARSHALDTVQVVMYAGTLGLKHDPSLIAKLAENIPPDCRVVVISEGQGRRWLEENYRENDKLVLLDYQPYEQLPEMLGSADILVALLEEDASRYSVPSKVLNYLCAGRAVLGLLPPENSVAKMIDDAGAGVVVAPSDRDQAVSALNAMLRDQAAREQMADNGRSYAERVFQMRTIGDSFERVLRKAIGMGCAAQPERNKSVGS